MENEIRKQWKLNAVAREFVIPNPESVIPNLVRDLFRAGLFRNLVFLVVLLCFALAVQAEAQTKNLEGITETTIDGLPGWKREIKKIPSGNGKYTAVLISDSGPLIREGQRKDERTSLFQYLDKNGKVLWERKDVDVRFFFPVACISHDGKRILIKEYRPQEGESYQYFDEEVEKEPMLYNEKGNVLWAFGKDHGANDIYLTKNGKYGYFGHGSSIVFFDVDKKKTHTYKGPFNEYKIDESGKVEIFKTVLQINVYKDGEVKVQQNSESEYKILQRFTKRLGEFTEQELSLLTAEELKQVKEALAKKTEISIRRKKLVHEFKF